MESSNKGNQSLSVPVAIVVAGVLIAGAVFLAKGSDTGPQAGLPTAQPTASGEINTDLEGAPFLGDENAPVVLVEYSDFACPWCGKFWAETLPLLKEEYIDTGKVKFVYKDFAVVGGEKAAEATHCAAEQGKYWEYHDMLFGNQAQDRTLWGTSEIHRSYAEVLGMDAQALVECLDEGRYQAKVASSMQEATSNGGTGTPFFIVNGQPISGAQPFSVFKSVIDLELENN